MACCAARRAQKAEARKILVSMYATREVQRAGAKCPLDGSETRVDWVIVGPVRLGYLKCKQAGHALPVGKRRR